ncbi:hypothetical protein ACFGVR_03765 [Mucilaginibacter sp. AW1-3]
MDKFKQYLNKHIDELGDDEPGARVWENLQKGLPVVRKVKPISSWYKYAAAACILILCSVGLWYSLSHNKSNVTPSSIAKTTVRPAAKRPQTESVTLPTGIASVKLPVRTKNTIKKRSYHRSTIAENTEITELKNVEASFTSVINLERRKINRTPLLAESKSYFNYFKTRFRKVDNDEAALKNEIREQGFTNDMLLQLITIYQQKLDILKDLQAEISKTNNLSQQGNRTTKEQLRSYINI